MESGQVYTKLSTVTISEALKFVYNFFQPELKESALEIIITPESLDKKTQIKTDRHFLDAIILNLVKNSIKFTETGQIYIGYEEEKEEIKFFVRDTGIGISQNNIESIFNRFQQADNELTRKYEGSGLGLSICKGYVELLGGRIWVESELGVGSTFYFTLPIH